MNPYLRDGINDSEGESLHVAWLHLQNFSWVLGDLVDRDGPYQGIRFYHSRGTRDIYLEFIDYAQDDHLDLKCGFVVPTRTAEDQKVWPRMDKIILALMTANKRIAAGEAVPTVFVPPEPGDWWVRCADGPAMGMRITAKGIDIGVAAQVSYRTVAECPKTVFRLRWDTPYQEVLPLLVEFYTFMRDDNLVKFRHMNRADIITFEMPD